MTRVTGASFSSLLHHSEEKGGVQSEPDFFPCLDPCFFQHSLFGTFPVLLTTKEMADSCHQRVRVSCFPISALGRTAQLLCLNVDWLTTLYGIKSLLKVNQHSSAGDG